MREASAISPTSAPSNDTKVTTTTLKHVSVKIVKAFVQSDGSHGNGAGVVILPRILWNETGNSSSSRSNEKTDDLNHFFPSDEICIAIAKQVGLPETSFVLILKDYDKLCDRHSADGSNVAADFHVKWYTPECEIDMCGHATIALAGYVYSIVEAKYKTDGYVNSNAGTSQPNHISWRMQCKAGLLGIDVFDGVQTGNVRCNSNYMDKNDSNATSSDEAIKLSRIVMEQARPIFCGIIDGDEIASSLSICAKNDLAIIVDSNNSERYKKDDGEKSSSLFPFPHCEIVSTGGRDLMVPIRSTVLKQMNIFGRKELGDNINTVSKKYDIVGYHMFEVDDDSFRNDVESEVVNRDNVEIKRSTQNVHLNDLIRIFQLAKKRGCSGSKSCLEAVIQEYDPPQDQNTSTTKPPYARLSRIIRVTGIRNFAPYVGIPEEPATGSANGALACYLVKHLFLEACCCDKSLNKLMTFRFCMEQGRVMGEPCLIDAEIEVLDGAIASVKVGGLVNVTKDCLDLDLTSIRQNIRST